VIDQNQFKMESDRLRQTHDIILRQLRNAESKLVEQQSETLTLQSQMWADVGLSSKSSSDDVLSGQYLDALRLNRAIKQDAAMNVLNLRHMEEHAYFGRVDFKRKFADTVRSTYIGISTLYDPETQEILICDWRAPISSLFYENATGDVSYEGPNGAIEGQLIGKRQYKCNHDELVYCLDSTLTIQDEILQETLSRHGDSHMHNIVSTIQEHQNRIICENIRSRIAVQGVAGSGKTAIALHRVAWLLYRYRRDALDYRQILFLTPNRAFISYIRDVLPELGEQNIPTSTLFDEVMRPIPSRYRLETPWDAAEDRLDRTDDAAKQEMMLRAALADESMWDLMGRFLQEKDENVHFPDFVFGEEILGKSRTLKHLYLTRSADTPMGKRMLRVRRLINDEIRRIYDLKMEELSAQHRSEGYRKKDAKIMAAHDCQELFQPLVRQIRELMDMDPVALFEEFLRYIRDHHARGREIYRYIQRDWWSKKAFSQEMAVIFTALRLRVHGAPAHRYRHVLLDEVQNYTPMQVHLVEMLYAGCGMTVLLDRHQHMNTGMPVGNWDFCDHRLTMDICYRSSRELTLFTRALLPEPEKIRPFDREGAKPVIRHMNRAITGADLPQILQGLEDPGRIAVITRTRRDAERLLRETQGSLPEIRLLTADDREAASDLSLVPSWLCQGLEFDTVIVWEPSRYCMPTEQGIFYTVCSRAQHQLLLIDSGRDYKPAVPEELFEEEWV